MKTNPETLARPVMTELAPPDDGIVLASDGYLASIRSNPDTVLAARGISLDVYDELLRDDQVRSTLQQRRTAVVSTEWTVEPGGDAAIDAEAADFVREQLARINLDDKTDKMLYGMFYGWSVAECMWGHDGQRITLDALRVRERDRFGFNHRGDLMLIRADAPQGVPMPERKFWTFTAGASHDDNPYGLGLAHSLYWPVFFKRNGIKFWLIFLEKFGMPTAMAKLPPGQYDQATERNKALLALRQIQTDAGIVVPDSMAIELIEAARSGTADYATLCERMDAAIAKVVLSQTMTTDNGSSLSQAEVHAGVAAAVVKADADLVCESLNRGPITWLTGWNFLGAKPPRVWRAIEQVADMSARAERDNKIAGLGFDPTEEYIAATYGPGWRKRRAPTVAPMASGPMGAEFTEVSPLAAQRVAHRRDQQDLADGAAMLATKYRKVYGARVEQLLALLGESQDLATFRERLDALKAEEPPASAVQAIERATFAARLMGRMRGQR